MSLQNPLLAKSKRFAVRIVKLCRYLMSARREYALTDQLIRSGTSIGANISEAQEAVSKKDFVNKLSIALKEARETAYWLEILHESELLTDREFESINTDLTELCRMLTTAIMTSKRTMEDQIE